ncbi:TorD/DmsD family molecular chaperone [Alkalilimnicola ehrlichii MLHE-1]|nr:molecular chaperone TorD family protein [Alkalilimnicola ehrlichii]
MPTEARDSDQTLRAATWQLLGTLLAAPPEESLLKELRQIRPESAPEHADRTLMNEGWRALNEMAEGYTPASLATEYQDLFIGAPEGELVPYASWYLTGSLMERPLVRLRADLQALGIVRQDGVTEPEDHAGALCEIMAFLVSDPDTPLAEEKRFFQTHIEPWMGRLMEDLQTANSARGYRAVGVFGERYLALEDRYLKMLA